MPPDLPAAPDLNVSAKNPSTEASGFIDAQFAMKSPLPSEEARPSANDSSKSLAAMGSKHKHPIYVEPQYGLVKALTDPDAYLRHICQHMIQERPWVSFDSIYKHLRCICTVHGDSQPSPAAAATTVPSRDTIKGGCQLNSQGVRSRGVTGDFPMSHRCFKEYNWLTSYLSSRVGAYKNWRDLVAACGDLPFPPEYFSAGFFAARTGLGHGSTRFTLAGGPRQKMWNKALAQTKLGYLHHDPKTPQGRVNPFWEGFAEYHSSRWEQLIKPAVKCVQRRLRRGTAVADSGGSEVEAAAGKKRKRQTKAEFIQSHDLCYEEAMKAIGSAMAVTPDKDNGLSDSPVDAELQLDHDEPVDYQKTVGDQSKGHCTPPPPKRAIRKPPIDDKQIQRHRSEEWEAASVGAKSTTPMAGSVTPEAPSTPVPSGGDDMLDSSGTQSTQLVLETSCQPSEPAGPPEDGAGLSPQETSCRDKARNIAEAVATSHLQQMILVHTHCSNPGTHLITHDGLPRIMEGEEDEDGNFGLEALQVHPRNDCTTPVKPLPAETPGRVRGTNLTPKRCPMAKCLFTPPRGSTALFSPRHIKIETPSTTRTVRSIINCTPTRRRSAERFFTPPR